MNEATTTGTRVRIKRVIVESLNLEGMSPDAIGDEDPLFGGELGLDSVDALELVVGLEKEFSIKIQSQQVGQESFESVATLAVLVEERQAAGATA